MMEDTRHVYHEHDKESLQEDSQEVGRHTELGALRLELQTTREKYCEAREENRRLKQQLAEDLYEAQKEYAKLMGEAIKLSTALMAVSFDERLPEDVRSNTTRSLEEFKQWLAS